MSDRKKWVYVRLSEEDHIALAYQASELGKRVADLAADYVEQILVDTARMSDDVQMKVYAATAIARRRDILRTQLEYIALSALRDEDEDAMRSLQSLCQETGFAVEEIVESASRFGSTSAGTGGARLDEIQMFLYRLLSAGPIPATAAKEAASQQGYSEGLTNKAKRRLGVKSYRRPSGSGIEWMWELQSGQEVSSD